MIIQFTTLIWIKYLPILLNFKTKILNANKFSAILLAAIVGEVTVFVSVRLFVAALSGEKTKCFAFYIFFILKTNIIFTVS